MRADLVIFDLDGVLVDSERLAVRLESRLLTELGWPLDADEVAARFVGRSAEHMRAEVEAKLGRPVDWSTEFDPHYVETFERELRPVDGARDTLEALLAEGVQVCVASSSSRDQIALKLRVADLAEYFVGRTYSAQDVDAPKPAPDIFRLAARTHAVPASHCLIVEDSPIGCEAARRAGIRTLGLVTTLVDPSRLRAEGATLIDRLGQVLDHVRDEAGTSGPGTFDEV